MKFIWLNSFYLATPRGLVFLIEMIVYHLVYGLCQPCTKKKSANKRQEDHVKYEASFLEDVDWLMAASFYSSRRTLK
jgi:hypothetical protein